MATEKDLIDGYSRDRIKCEETMTTTMEESVFLQHETFFQSQEINKPQKSSPVSIISPPTEAPICKCSHQCNQLTLNEKLVLFNAYQQKTYDEQSAYIVYKCMDLIEPKRRKIKKEISQRQATFLYKLQLDSKIISVCQGTLRNVLGVTSRRIQVLQNKMKNAKHIIDLSDKRGKHFNRPHRVSDNIIRKIQEHINSIPREDSHLRRGIPVKRPVDRSLSVTKLYQLFCEKYPEIQVSRKTYNNVWKTDPNSSERELSEDSDDPINEQLNSEECDLTEIIEFKEETVRDSLEADGHLSKMKAEMRTEVMKLLDDSSKSSRESRPKSPHDILLLNELIREYLDWIGYKYTSSVFVAECELGKQPLDRIFLARDLGVRETETSQKLPLLYCLVKTYKDIRTP